MSIFEQIVVALNHVLGPALHMMSSGSSQLALMLGLI